MQKIGLLVVAPILISPILSGELRSEAITATLVSIFGLNSASAAELRVCQ
jgi:hypothetical protein